MRILATGKQTKIRPAEIDRSKKPLKNRSIWRRKMRMEVIASAKLEKSVEMEIQTKKPKKRKSDRDYNKLPYVPYYKPTPGRKFLEFRFYTLDTYFKRLLILIFLLCYKNKSIKSFLELLEIQKCTFRKYN